MKLLKILIKVTYAHGLFNNLKLFDYFFLYQHLKKNTQLYNCIKVKVYQ